MLWRLLFWIWAEENAIGNEVKDNLSWLHTEKDKKKKNNGSDKTQEYIINMYSVLFFYNALACNKVISLSFRINRLLSVLTTSLEIDSQNSVKSRKTVRRNISGTIQ